MSVSGLGRPHFKTYFTATGIAVGLVCSAGGTCALLTPMSVKGTIVRAKAKALLKTRTQK